MVLTDTDRAKLKALIAKAESGDGLALLPDLVQAVKTLLDECLPLDATPPQRSITVLSAHPGPKVWQVAVELFRYQREQEAQSIGRWTLSEGRTDELVLAVFAPNGAPMGTYPCKTSDKIKEEFRKLCH